jgi:hypothetical protein
MSTGKVGGGSSAPRPAAPKPAAPAPSSSSPAKSSTPAAKPAATSAGSSATGSSSSSSTGSTSTGSTTKPSSTSSTDKSTDTGSTSSTSKDDDKDSSSTTSTEDKFEKSKEASTEDGKKGKESFNDRFIDNLRKSYEPESSEVKDKIGQVEQQLSKDNFSAVEGKDAIAKLESTASDLKEGSRRDKLEARVAELKKEVAERERSEDKVKAADARDDKGTRAQQQDDQKVQAAGGVEGDIKSDLKDERQRLKQPKDDDKPGAKKPANDKSVARAGENDPETEQISKQRQLEEAEEGARQRLSDFRENNNHEAMASVQRAYDAALSNREQTAQTLQQELSNYYPADKAGELAQQALANKENFFSSFGTLHALGDKSSQEGLSKLNPDAAKLFSKENGVSGAGPEEQLGQVRDSLQTRAVGPADGASETVTKDAVGQLEGSVADIADTRESVLRGRVRDLKDASEAKGQSSKGFAEQGEDKAQRLKDQEGKLGGAAAERGALGTSASGEGEKKAEDAKAVGGDNKAKNTEDKQTLAVTEKKDVEAKAEPKTGEGDEKEVKVAGVEAKEDAKADREVAAKDEKEVKVAGVEAKEDVKTDREVAEKDITAISAEAKDGKFDRTATKEIQSAYDAAIADREKTVQALEKEFSSYYSTEKARDLSQEAVSSKEDFYAHYGALHSVGDQGTKDNLAKINPAAAKLFPSEPKTGFEPKKQDALQQKTDKSVDAKADDLVPRQSKVSPRGENEASQSVAQKPEVAQLPDSAKNEDQAAKLPSKKVETAQKELEAKKLDGPEGTSVSKDQEAIGTDQSDEAIAKKEAAKTDTIDGKSEEIIQKKLDAKELDDSDKMAVSKKQVAVQDPEVGQTDGAITKKEAVKTDTIDGKSDEIIQKKLDPKKLDGADKTAVSKEQEAVQSPEVGQTEKAIAKEKAAKIAATGGKTDEIVQKKLDAKKLDGADKTAVSKEQKAVQSPEVDPTDKAAIAKKKEAQTDTVDGKNDDEILQKKLDAKKLDAKKLEDSDKTESVGEIDEAGTAAAASIGKTLGGAVAEGSKLVSKATEAVTSKISDAVGGLFGSKSEAGGEGGAAAGEAAEGAVGDGVGGAEAPPGSETPQTEGAVEPQAAEAPSEEERTEELTDGQRRLKASRDEARSRLEEYRENGDTESLESIDKAYERARQNPEETQKTLEEQLAKVYPEEQAKEMAKEALESKEGFYSQFSSLQRNATDEESKTALETVNPEAAELAAKEQSQTVAETTAQTAAEQVQTVSGAIQDSFQEKVKADPENFKKQLQEAYPDADEKAITDLMKQAEEGNFPVPEDIKFVPAGDDALGTGSSHYDADKKQLVLSEDLKHNPAALQRAMLEGTASHLDQEMGVEKGFLAAFNLSGENDQHGAKLVTQVQDDVAARSNAEAVARTKGFDEATADPETSRRTQDALRTELEQRFSERLKERGVPDRVAEYRARVRSEFISQYAMKDAESFDGVFNKMYERGDPAARERLRELNPTMAALAESRLNTPREEQALNVQETGAATAYERYRDAKSDGPHLDPISDVAKGFERATRDDAKPTTDALQKIYEERGLRPERALEKAQEAVSSEKGLYSQYSALWKTADEQGKEKLRELNPELAGLMDREKAGTLKTDDQWRQDVRDSHTTPLIGDWMANNAIKKAEAKLTTTSQSDEQRNLAGTFQAAIKDRANEDPAKFAQDLRTAFPQAEQETIDGLVELAKDGNFPLAQKVNFVDKDDPLLNGGNASYDSQSKNIYIDKELLKDPDKVLSAYVEENGHHLDKLLGGGDSQGDEGALLESTVLKSGGISFLDESRAKVEDDYEIVIGDDGVVKVIENQTGPGPVVPPITPGPITPNPGPITPNPGPVTPNPSPVTPTPGPITPGPVTPGPVTGPVTPGPVTGPVTPGPVTPRPSPVTPGPVNPTPSPVPSDPVRSQPVPPPSAPSPSPVSPSPDPSSPKPSPVEPSRDNWKPARNLRAPDESQVREAQEAREAAREKEFKANFDPKDIRNLDELKHLDDAMAKLKDLPKALEQLDKIKEALKGGKGLSESLSDLKNLTKTMDSLKGLAGNLDSLERLGKLQGQLKDMPQRLANMETLPSALETLGNLNKSMSDLQKLPRMLEQLRDLPRQMSQLEQLPNTLNRFNKLPDNINDLGKLSGFLDAAREVPGRQVKTNGARAVAADRILSGKIVGARPVKGGKTGPKVSQSGRVAGPSGTETGGKAARIAGGGSTVPYVGRFGGSTGLGPSIGREASRQTQSRPGSSQASKAVSKAGGLGRAGVGGPGKGAPSASFGGPKGIPIKPGAGGPKGASQPALPTASGPKAPAPGVKPAPRPGATSPNAATPAKPGASLTNPAAGPRLGAMPGMTTPRPAGKPGPGTPIGRPALPALSGASAPAAKTAPAALPAAEYQQLSQRLNTAGARPESNSLSRLQNMLTGPSDGMRQLPGVLKSLESLPKSMSSVSRLNGLLGKKDGLAKGVAGLTGLAEVAKSSSGTMKSLDGLSTLLRSVQSSPDAYGGLKRMPGLVNHLGGIQGDSNPEAMSRLLKTVQNRPDALEGLKTYQNLMTTLQKPEMARSLDQLNKMVQSGQLDKLAQSGQKLAMDLQKPQAVFGMDKLESMFFKAKANPEAMKGLDRLDQMLGGRDRQGAAIGVDRLGSLLQTAKSQPNMMRQIVERVVQPSQGQTASTAQTTGKATAGTTPGVAVPGSETGAVANQRGLDRRGGDRRATDRRVGAAGSVAATSSAASAGAVGGAKSPGRLRDYRQIFNMLSEVGQGTPGATEHPGKLAEMSRGTQGAHAVADAMEAQVVAKPDRMLDTLTGMTKTSESRQAFGKTLANMAEATPDRLVGILLLTSDVAGGQQAVANMFGQLAADPQSSGSLGKVIGAGTRTETGAAGMKDLLTNMMATDDNGDHTRATQTAQTFASASRTKAGARGLAEGLTNLTTLSGGARDVGGMVRQMSRTKEGARATGELLMNMASDRQGAKDLGKVLARASKSTAGGRDLLASFAKIAQTDAGRNDVSRLMVRLTESEHGAKMLSHMARDRGNAKSLAGLLNQVAESPQAASRMNFALERALHNPQARTEMQVFRGRMASDVGLREAVDRMTQAPTQSQPLQLSQSVKGADALARVTAFENLARAVGERPVEAPVKTVEAAGSSSSGGTTDGSQNPGERQNPENRPFPNQTQPYPDLAAVSDVWRNQSIKPEGGERLAEQAQGAAAAEGEDSRSSDNQKNAFRPGDVYSDLTLLRARICGDCGFRTNAMGKCGRCGFNLLQEQPRV